jgi:hypothetical protein
LVEEKKMPRGGSKKGEHRGNAKPKPDGVTPNAVLKRAVAPRRPGTPKTPIHKVEEDVFISQVIHGIRDASDMTPKQVMLDNMHHFQNAAYQYEAMVIMMTRQPDSEETRRAIAVYEMEVERHRRIASDEAYKVAPFVHPRLAAIAVRGDTGHGDDIVQLMLDEIDAKNREHPMVIEHLPQKKTA